MKLFLAACLLLYNFSYSQSSDFILLKKNNKTEARYYAGTNISFLSTNGAFINAKITEIKNDTLYLQEFIVQRALTTFGTIVPDTVGSYHYQFHYNEIKSIGYSKRQNFDWKGSGAALLGGGTLLTLGSGVVYLADRKKFSAPLMAASAGLATLGYFMAKGKSNGKEIGKKYRLQYMNMSHRAI
ncbi:MAG: hypothetical protein ABJA78_07680 [Ferruginibacter sp.]